MFPVKFYVLLILPVLVTLSQAQHNVTVNNTSPSISYEGKAINSPICQVNSNGTLQPNQPGCYNAPSGCTLGATMGPDDINSAASFSFKGSAIYIESLLNFFSPIYTVTIDGQSTDIDGVRPSGAFICAPIFSKTGLDPSVEHKVRLSVKGPSPNRNMSFVDSEKDFVFSLISYTFTEGGDFNDTAPVTNSTGSGPRPTTTDSADTATSSTPSSAVTLRSFGRNTFVAAVMVAWSLLF